MTMTELFFDLAPESFGIASTDGTVDHRRPVLEPFAEVDCSIEHDGRTFTAAGASIDERRAVVYVGKQLGGVRDASRPSGWAGDRVMSSRRRVNRFYLRQHEATDWHGNRVGFLQETGCWPVPNGYVSGWLHSYTLTLDDGRTYSVRGSGEGMAAVGRRTS